MCTSDIRYLRDLSKTLEIWVGSIISTAPGSGTLSFDFISEAGGNPIFLKWGDQFSQINNSDTIDYVYNSPGTYDNFKIIVGFNCTFLFDSKQW